MKCPGTIAVAPPAQHQYDDGAPPCLMALARASWPRGTRPVRPRAMGVADRAARRISAPAMRAGRHRGRRGSAVAGRSRWHAALAESRRLEENRVVSPRDVEAGRPAYRAREGTDRATPGPRPRRQGFRAGPAHPHMTRYKAMRSFGSAANQQQERARPLPPLSGRRVRPG